MAAKKTPAKKASPKGASASGPARKTASAQSTRGKPSARVPRRAAAETAEPTDAPAKNARAKKATTKRAATKASAEKAAAKRAAPKSARVSDAPKMFRMNVEVGDLDAAEAGYNTLFGVPGRRQAGSRLYFDCGAVTLQVVDVSTVREPHALPKSVYFTVQDLDAVHARATELGWLSAELVHGSRAGDITVRPWGERSFYANDPWQNQFCFVEAGTTYPG